MNFIRTCSTLFLFSFFIKTAHSQSSIENQVQTNYSGLQTISFTDTGASGNCTYILYDQEREIATYNAFGLDNFEGNLGQPSYFTNADYYCSDDPIWNDADFSMDGLANLSNHRDALDAHFSAAVTYDFFSYFHDWQGLNGDGTGSILQYLNLNYCIGSCSHYIDQADAEFGTIKTALPVDEKSNSTFDIIAHELGHIYIGKMSPSLYNSPTILSEAMADIVAAMVNIYFNQDPDLCTAEILKKAPWIFIEEFNHSFKRDAINGFHLFNSPAYLAAPSHEKSTTVYHWFYQIVDGDCSIGFDKAASLVLDAITEVNTSDPTEQIYAFYYATIDNDQLTDTEQIKVIDAWAKVGINCTARNLQINEEDIDSYQAKITWDESLSDSYRIYLNGEFYQETTQNHIILSQLEENGCYIVEAKGVCDGIVSTYSESLEFNTSDNTGTKTESFEPFIKKIFTNTSSSDNMDWNLNQTFYPVNNIKAYHCEAFAFISSFLNYDKSANLLSDKIDMETYEGAALQFHYLTSNPFNGKIILKAKIMPLGKWKTIWQTNKRYNTNSEWEKVTLNLNQYVGHEIKLRFTGFTGTSGFNYMGLDQIKIINANDIFFSRQHLNNPAIQANIYNTNFDQSTNTLQIAEGGVIPKKLFITNIAGQVVYQDNKINQANVSLGHLNTGVYFVSILDEEARIHTSKIFISQ